MLGRIQGSDPHFTEFLSFLTDADLLALQECFLLAF